MSRRTLNILGILILMGLSALIGVVGYIYTVGGSGEPSTPIDQAAPTLDLSSVTLEAQISALSTQVADAQATNAALAEQLAAAAAATAEPAAATPEATAETAAVEPTAEPAAAAATLYRIVAEESEVRFILTEDLRGTFTTVIGKTNQVAGDIFVDFGNPSASKVGDIRINARTLATDNDFRNRALRSEILQSSQDAYEFIDFTPTAITGLPESLSVGEEVTFQIEGNLKIRDITQAVTFSVTAVAESEDRLTGSASADVTRTQFNLSIPNVPGVTNVSDEVKLEIDFVATKAS